MTVREYLNEHSAHEGLYTLNVCAYCGEEIERGWSQFSDGTDFLHAECFLEWVIDNIHVDDIAYGLGFVKESAL